MAVSVKTTVTYQVLTEFLADEAWHDAEATMRIGMASVPPGVALRLADKERERAWKVDHPDHVGPIPPRKRNMSVDLRIRIGSRMYVTKVLRNKVFEWNEDRTKVRLNPMRKYQYNGRGTYMFHQYREKPEPLTEEQMAEVRKERARQAWRTRMIKKGLDPDAPREYEKRAKAKAEWDALSPEEKKARNAERARKGFETRRQKRKEQGGQIQSPGGHPGHEGHGVLDDPQPDR